MLFYLNINNLSILYLILLLYKYIILQYKNIYGLYLIFPNN